MWTDDDFTSSPEFSPDFDPNLASGTPARPALGVVIRRRAWLWVTAAVVGLALGGAAFHVKPPPYKATTSVLLMQSPTSPPQDQILTEVALVESRTVAAAAMRALGLPLSVKAVERFSASISATPLTDRVIQITVKGKSSSQAVSAAKATATAFLLIRNEELRAAERSTIAALTGWISNATQQLQALTAQIAALHGHSLTAAQQSKLASLLGQQSEAKGNLTGLKQAAATFESTAAVTTATMVHGSQVLDPAIPAPRSHLKYPLLYFGGGMFGGLAIGLGIIVIQAFVSRRLRRRDDIARALGGPVLLSVGRVRAGGLLGRSWPAAARRPAVRQIVDYLRRSLPVGQETSTLAVVAVDDLRVPALALASLASSYARGGKRVLIADLTASMAVGHLLDVTEVGVRLTEADGHEVLVAVPEPGDGLPQGPVKTSSPADQPLGKAYRTADIMLTLATLDPALGADHLPTWASDAVVMLTAGVSSATKINAVGEMIRAAGTALISAVVLDADRSDESLGFATSPADDIASEAAPDRTRTVGKVGGAHEEKAASDKVGAFEPINGSGVNTRDVNARDASAGDVNGGGMIGSEPSHAWRR
jgi:capsular polysaccharide biosynthesis protein